MSNSNYTAAQSQWDQAKSEVKKILSDRAGLRGMMSYSELVSTMQSLKFDAHDPQLFRLLDEVSSEEDAAGRGMLTVIVVHKVGDMQPGHGFFELAKRLGRNTKDILRCWVDELHRVHAVWS